MSNLTSRRQPTWGGGAYYFAYAEDATYYEINHRIGAWRINFVGPEPHDREDRALCGKEFRTVSQAKEACRVHSKWRNLIA
jgi:hypothetical protein